MPSEQFQPTGLYWPPSVTNTAGSMYCGTCAAWVGEGHHHLNATTVTDSSEQVAFGRIATAMERIAAALERKL